RRRAPTQGGQDVRGHNLCRRSDRCPRTNELQNPPALLDQIGSIASGRAGHGRDRALGLGDRKFRHQARGRVNEDRKSWSPQKGIRSLKSSAGDFLSLSAGFSTFGLTDRLRYLRPLFLEVRTQPESQNSVPSTSSVPL